MVPSWDARALHRILAARRAACFTLLDRIEDKFLERRRRNAAIIERWRDRKQKSLPKRKISSREDLERVHQYNGELDMLEAGLRGLASPQTFAAATDYARHHAATALHHSQVKAYRRGLEKEYHGLRFLVLGKRPEGNGSGGRSAANWPDNFHFLELPQLAVEPEFDPKSVRKTMRKPRSVAKDRSAVLAKPIGTVMG